MNHVAVISGSAYEQQRQLMQTHEYNEQEYGEQKTNIQLSPELSFLLLILIMAAFFCVAYKIIKQ